MKVNVQLDLDKEVDLKAWERLVGYTTPTPPEKKKSKPAKKASPIKEEKADDAPTTESEVTEEEVRTALRKYAVANGRQNQKEGVEKAFKIMEEVGATRQLSDFPVDKYADLIAALNG